MGNAKRDKNRIPTILGVSSSDDITPVAVGVDETTKRMRVDSVSEEHGHCEVNDGSKTITTAGARVQLSSTSIPCKRVYIEAHEDNTGAIVVGGSSVVASKANRRGMTLFPTQGEWFKINNLNLIYLDAISSGDKVNFYYET